VVIRWGKVRRVGWMWKILPVGSWMATLIMFAVCVWSGVVILKNHSMSLTWAFLLDFFLQTLKLLTIALSSDGQVPLMQFHIPPDAQHGCPERRVSLMSKLPCLKHANHFGLFFNNKVFSIDGTNVLGCL
jgi:hypothetical protein